ncbi:MAG: hypothetical protein HW421_231 [Ignavibacteria bacterium]|nr:hypothetical protein [Ignavibacteria bacterium]
MLFFIWCKTIIILGSFPHCYDISDINKINIKSKLKHDSTSFPKISINWALKTCSAEPEAEIYRIFNSLKINIVNNSEVVPKRNCNGKSKSYIYSIFFDKLNKEQSKDFQLFISNNFGHEFSLTIWSDSPEIQKNFNFDIKQNNSDLLINYFGSLEKGKWSSIGLLITKAIEQFKKINESYEKRLIIVGNLPLQGNSKQLSQDTWKSFKDVENLKVYFYLPTGLRKNITDSAIIGGLKFYQIDFSEF